MKLRYQMRGLGIGIIVTAVLMGVATNGRLPMSDAEIRARALELGMVDSNSLRLTDVSGQGSGEESTPAPDSGTVPDNVLSDGQDAGDDSGLEDAAGPGISGGEDTDSLGGSGGEDTDSLGGSGGEDTDSLEDFGGEEADGIESSDGEEADSLGDAEKITIVIEQGITSQQICRLLAEAGLVEDAYALDRYLCDNGYSTKIQHGSYEIAANVSQEELIRIITGGR